MSNYDDDAQNKKPDKCVSVLVTAIVLVLLCAVCLALSGCETSHKWDGYRSVHFCGFYCIEYKEDAVSHRTGNAQQPATGEKQ